MARIWEYNGYTIDEGLKPHDENYKGDYYQYFFIVKKDEARVMKFCVWAPRDGIDQIDEVKAFTAGGSRPGEFIRAKGLERVKALIDAGEFENKLMEITIAGVREVPLDELPDKLT